MHQKIEINSIIDRKKFCHMLKNINPAISLSQAFDISHRLPYSFRDALSPELKSSLDECCKYSIIDDVANTSSTREAREWYKSLTAKEQSFINTLIKISKPKG